MSYLDVKMAENQLKFNWDDIDVGNNHLDHSENFFAKKHYEHERLDEIQVLQQNMTNSGDVELSGIEELLEDFKIDKNGHMVAPEEGDDKENVDTSNNDKTNIKKEPVTSPVDVKCKPSKEAKQESPLDVTDKPSTQVKKIVCQWSAQKPVASKCVATKGAISKSMPPPPQAYLVKDLYQRKREEAERRRNEEEKKQREFHPRPAPNFNAYHDLMQKRKNPHACTVAVTPQVLKKSKEAEERRKKKLEEWKKKNSAPKFEARPPSVLKGKPFVPQKKPTVIQQAPFNLSGDRRAMERKHYDEIKQKALEDKKKQVEIEEEERKKREEEIIRELRKAATFKARPNPFKH